MDRLIPAATVRSGAQNQGEKPAPARLRYGRVRVLELFGKKAAERLL